MQAVTIGSLLDQMEALLGRLGPGSGKQALELLLLMDEVNARIQEQNGREGVLVAEKTQFASIQARVKKDAAVLLRELRGAAGLQVERSRHNAVEAAWWWRLEKVVAEANRNRVRHALKIFGIVALVAGLLAGIYWFFLQPDPADIARMNATDKAQAVAREGNIQEALTIVEEGLTVAVDDPQLLIVRGVLLEMAGRMEEAEQVFDRAQSLIGESSLYHQARAEAYLGLDLIDEAVDEAEQGVIIDPVSANGFLILGQCLQTQGDTGNARLAYQEAIRLAELSGEAEIAAQASVLMAYLP